MSNYHPVYVDIWNDADFSEYDSFMQLIFLYLITNERCKLSGIYKITLKQIAFSVNSDLNKIEKVLSKFPEKQVQYDFRNCVVYVRNFFKYNLNKIGNPKTIAATLFQNNKFVPHFQFWEDFFSRNVKIIELLNSRISDSNFLILKDKFQCEVSLSPDFNNNNNINNNINNNKKLRVDTTKNVEIKEKVGEFENVKLTQAEIQKLLKKFGDLETKNKIEALSEYIKSKGDKYKDHYATILSWDRRNKSK